MSFRPPLFHPTAEVQQRHGIGLASLAGLALRHGSNSVHFRFQRPRHQIQTRFGLLGDPNHTDALAASWNLAYLYHSNLGCSVSPIQLGWHIDHPKTYKKRTTSPYFPHLSQAKSLWRSLGLPRS